jgi:hypothetical protein
MPGDIMSHHELDHRAILQEEIAGYEPQWTLGAPWQGFIIGLSLLSQKTHST